MVKVTYNCLSVDGDQSTNDMVAVMANGMAGNAEITAEGEERDRAECIYIQLIHGLDKCED